MCALAFLLAMIGAMIAVASFGAAINYRRLFMHMAVKNKKLEIQVEALRLGILNASNQLVKQREHYEADISKASQGGGLKAHDQ